MTFRAGDIIIASENEGLEIVITLAALIFINRHVVVLS